MELWSHDFKDGNLYSVSFNERPGEDLAPEECCPENIGNGFSRTKTWAVPSWTNPPVKPGQRNNESRWFRIQSLYQCWKRTEFIGQGYADLIVLISYSGIQSLENSGEGRAGNGIRFDSSENMFIADYKGHNILHYNMIRVAHPCYVRIFVLGNRFHTQLIAFDFTGKIRNDPIEDFGRALGFCT